MRASANLQKQKPEAQVTQLTRYVFTICPWEYGDSQLTRDNVERLQKNLIEHLKRCGFQPIRDFTYASPNSMDMISYERHRAILSQYYITFNNTGIVLKALKTFPDIFALRCEQGPLDYAQLRMTYMMQHNDDEPVMPADLKEIMDMHERSYRELSAKVAVAIQTSAGDNHPALVNFQAAAKYIDSLKDDPYLVESSRYTMLMLSLWYVTQELADTKPEETSNKGFFDKTKAIFGKKKAEASPVNQQYKVLLEENVKRLPARLNDASVATKTFLKDLYMEKVGKHITTAPVLRK